MIQPDESNCVGCEACAAVCPSKCIQMQTNTHGFAVPKVNMNDCVDCGACESVCPVQHSTFSHANSTSPMLAYAAFNRDRNVRYTSTSGGVFTELAATVLEDGGYVAGAVYTEQQEVVHIITTNQEELSRLRQSKYVQSRKGDIYRKVKEALREDKPVLFAGCPCEVAALSNYLRGINKDKLLLVDFVCLGANSPLAFRKYLEDLERKYHSSVLRVWFKNKEKTWNRFCTRVDFENGRHYLADRYTDPYMRCYIVKPLIIRRSCENCRFKEIPHGSDITMADFWGVEKVVREIDSRHGVSLVYINSNKGRNLLTRSAAFLQLYPVNPKLTQCSNPMATRSVVLDPGVDMFFQRLSGGTFTDAVNAVMPTDLSYMLKTKLYTLKKHILHLK